MMGLKMMIGAEGMVRGNGNLVHMEYRSVNNPEYCNKIIIIIK